MASKIRSIRRQIIRKQARRGVTGSQANGALFAAAWKAYQTPKTATEKTKQELIGRALLRFGLVRKAVPVPTEKHAAAVDYTNAEEPAQ